MHVSNLTHRPGWPPGHFRMLSVIDKDIKPGAAKRDSQKPSSRGFVGELKVEVKNSVKRTESKIVPLRVIAQILTHRN